MQDENWKKIIESCFEDFVYFFLPDLANEIDFKKGYEFLDKELQKIAPEAEEKKRYVDKLSKVYLKDGQEKWVLIHIEVQGYRDENFSERMFSYFYRIYDRYKKKIAALVIFTDDDLNYEPNQYQYDFFGTKLDYKYRTYKIKNKNEVDLLKDENPFALVVLATKYALEIENNEEQKLKFKLKLMRLLLERGYSKKEIRDLFIFVDSTIKLTDVLKQKILYDELEKLKGGRMVQVMGDFEEVAKRRGWIKGVKEGKKEGRKEGRKEEKMNSIIKLLDKGFSEEEVIELLEVDEELIKEAKNKVEND
ncbi:MULTISPECIES: Rpn family recombination-promoting nuclease/putative transposase [unclassified Candidatus Frackibacter]|uniref:Rpn family recombination-promoting nuclease/putative transposase n=1 Tax=unclassified Candidatus Frackibacter TaxID=2648818 RepID=UPI0008866803|nr:MULTISPECIES: Rpn family recombination-promoting nuclease/putative transposase [unclassified Candidatus Frackibacter]SDC83940.1 conserved hypothetical protein (putative transposase or invertase) [Candidatus Frackibacter sp. WG11]SEM98412.1 conserved hypothetical protein (putative transposase or invertase) [Candidatus Frackibacter sp. WG12]SFM05058.1 conserved hypothetical protein (putative transposase or invertase) [Candidatus Frackibacter sp. WG13]